MSAKTGPWLCYPLTEPRWVLGVWKAPDLVERSSTASWDGRDLKRGRPFRHHPGSEFLLQGR